MQLSIPAGPAPAGLRAEGRRAMGAAQRRAGGGRRLAVHASSLESKGLFTTNSSLLGPKAPGQGGPSLGPASPSSSAAAKGPTLDEVPLESGMGVDYTQLRDLLKEGKWREAEDETRAKLIEAAGPEAVKRGWVYFSEVKFIPDADMRCLDELWRAASGGKFGYSAQRELWLQSRQQWQRFFKAIDWVQGENNTYRKWPTEFIYSLDAPKGHLPLTNALRGTRLFEAIMGHPAIVNSRAAAAGGGGAAAPSWLK